MPQVMKLYTEEVSSKFDGLARYELPKKLIILHREFDLNADEITPKLSVRRKVIEQHFADQIEAAYADKEHANGG